MLGLSNEGSDPGFAKVTALAFYANVTELGLGRSVECWETSINNTSVQMNSVDCLASNHGALPGASTPNAPQLTAAAGSGTSFAAV